MTGRRQERHLQKRREALERALEAAPAGSGALLSPEERASVFFHDHADLVRGLAEVLEARGLVEAFQALARHQEEDRDHWLLRLERLKADPALGQQRAELDGDYLEVLAAHFRHWGAAGPQGVRIAEQEAALALAALRTAERLWLEGRGRPMLPLLVQEALAVLWPALYGHARRHQPR
jgi:hypothetical protein